VKARPESEAMHEARRALALPKGEPIHVPQASAFRGRKVKPLPGQLDFDGREARGG
jgi:hypothetical protein